MRTRKRQNNNIVTDDDQQVEEDHEILKDIEDEEEARTEAPSPNKKRKRAKRTSNRKTTSVHWKDYDKVMVKEGDPPVQRMKAQCKHCGKLIAADSRGCGTNGLKNHTISCSKNNAKDGDGQTILAYTVDGGNRELTTWKFDQKTIRLGLCKMILLDELPFLFVEREGFQYFMRLVCPQFQIPSRQTIRSDCVQLFLEEKQSLVKFFQRRGMGRVSITTDCWTSVNNNNFICVTAHYIGKDWILHKKIINFSKIDSHKGDDIGAAVVKSLRDWGLNHLFSCTLDNASQNDTAIGAIQTHMELNNIDILGGKYFHVRCAAHVLNLIVKDGLKEIGISIRRVREAVRWLKSSPQRWGSWEKVLDYLGDKIDCKKKLCMDVPTRWNSTYLMLESAIPYAEAFTTFGITNSSYGNDLRERKYNDKPIGPPVEEDWVNVKKMISYLKKFHSFTQILSITKKPTSHLFFTEMCGIFDLIRRLEMSSDYDVSSMASRMRLKIGKYWLEETELNVKMNKILYMAAVLDPRQKMKHVETCLKLLYGNARGLEMVKEVRDSLRELFEFYSARYAPRPPSRSSVDTNKENSSCEEDTYSMFAMYISDDDEDSSNQTELDIYLTDTRHKVRREEMASFDLLKWWSEHTHYHVLSEMARDILAIPVSSVASESAFSMGGRVLSPYRSSLSCTMVEALICAGDWLKTCDLDKKDEEGVDEEEQEKEYRDVLVRIEAMATTSNAHGARVMHAPDEE